MGQPDEREQRLQEAVPLQCGPEGRPGRPDWASGNGSVSVYEGGGARCSQGNDYRPW